jgi:hypothetical protein
MGARLISEVKGREDLEKEQVVDYVAKRKLS